MEFVEQEAGGRDEEGKHLVPAVVKAAGAPALVFHPVPLAALVKRLSVKLIEAVRILGEVRGHPVEDDADPRIVEGIDERHEIFGRAEAGSHGKVARHLVPPRTVEGEFRHGHEFDVRIAHLLDIGNELARKVEIGIIISVVVFFPREQIDLVDVHRRGVDILFVERIEISAVLPFVPLEVVELGRIRRRSFGVEADGIGLHELPAVRRRDAVFVDVVLLETGDEQFERLPVHHALHDVGFGIPAVEVTDDGNALGVRSPDAEHIPFLAVLRLLVGAEDLVNTVVLAVVIEIEREIRLFAHIELLAHLLLFAHETPLLRISAKVLYLVVRSPHRTMILYYIPLRISIPNLQLFRLILGNFCASSYFLKVFWHTFPFLLREKARNERSRPSTRLRKNTSRETFFRDVCCIFGCYLTSLYLSSLFQE